METVALGRTGLAVSVAGLGCGGHSGLGQRHGASEAESRRVVQRALDLGINLIDTAAAYGTEEIVGKALAGRRGRAVISTKALTEDRDGPIGAEKLVRRLEASLTRLQTDYVDVYHLHGVLPDQYDHCVAELVPALVRAREQGKIRFLGLTERFVADPQHRMLARAVRDDFWDVVMTGFNLVNPSARERVFEPAQAQGIGTLVMFAVRRALSQPHALRELIAGLVERGEIPERALDSDDPLGFLVHAGGAANIVDAAYRFCRHEPGAHVVLTGTGNVAHLEANVRSMLSPALPRAEVERLRQLFGTIDTVSGN